MGGEVIRAATRADVPGLVTMGRLMRARTVYAAILEENPAAMAALAEALIAGPAAGVWVADGAGGLRAMFGAQLYTHPFTGAYTLGEVFWYSLAKGPGFRVYLAAVAWGLAQGAVDMTMGVPIGADDVRDLYARLGFTAIEVGYVKHLRPHAAGVAA